jgi:4-hydroxy-2-oxoheptanedioate aldolase
MIETREGLDNLEAILATPGLDGIYVGPNDFALALGCAPVPESDDPIMTGAIARIQAATAKAGKISGIFCSGGAGAARRVREGFDLVTPGNDAMLLKGAIASSLREVKAAQA